MINLLISYKILMEATSNKQKEKETEISLDIMKEETRQNIQIRNEK